MTFTFERFTCPSKPTAATLISSLLFCLPANAEAKPARGSAPLGGSNFAQGYVNDARLLLLLMCEQRLSLLRLRYQKSRVVAVHQVSFSSCTGISLRHPPTLRVPCRRVHLANRSGIESASCILTTTFTPVFRQNSALSEDQLPACPY